ncbi:MAG: glycoside hydrolase family 13 protein [Christensenellaceae bacterium]
MINRKALFSDETADFKTPYQPKAGDEVTIRIRGMGEMIAHVIVNGKREEMFRRAGGMFDVYEYTFVCPETPVSYYFELTDRDDRAYYNRMGVVENHLPRYAFGFTPGAYVPKWALGTVYYQIYTDRFCNGEPSNDVIDREYYYTGGHVRRIRDWDKTPDELDVNNFYGGDLQGVREKLDYIESLGVETIYFNPLFVSPSNHKYDTQDYDFIDPHLAIIEEDEAYALDPADRCNAHAKGYIRRVGSRVNLEKSNAYFAELVQEIHARGMRVIMDGVFNHCGSFNKWLDREGIYARQGGFEKGAYQSAKSPYRSFFKFAHERTARSRYEGWWDYATLPKLNYEQSPSLEGYVVDTGKKWVSAPFGADGWRLDVAADLGHTEAYNHEFWQKFRTGVREANPEAIIMAEHYGDPASWLQGNEWDTVMNYDAFMEPVTWFLTGVEKHCNEFDKAKLGDGELFVHSMLEAMSRFPRPALDAALNQLSNHDHSRFLTRTNRTAGSLAKSGSEAAAEGIDKRLMKLGVLMQMTWPGAPGVYYGDEAGVVGWTDPDCRRTYPWGREDEELIAYHREAIALRKRISCLRLGSVKPLDQGSGYVAYARFDRTDCAVVIVNESDEPLSLSVPVWEAGVQDGAEMFCAFATEGEQEKKSVSLGRIEVTLPPRSGKVYTIAFTH